ASRRSRVAAPVERLCPLLWLTAAAAVSGDAASAQEISISLDGGTGVTERAIQIIALITVLSLAPSILVMVTSFTRIVVVLSLLRTALGVQQSPPNAVIISLALFLTAFVMAPVFTKAYDDGIRPLVGAEIEIDEAFSRASKPFHAFMMHNVREKDLAMFVYMARAELPGGLAEAASCGSKPCHGVMMHSVRGKGLATCVDMARAERPVSPDVVSLPVLVPAFMISELRRAFEIGSLQFVPFIVIDMVVASVLMSMGMMMLPPIIISLPFKLVFFVLVDGWHLVDR